MKKIILPISFIVYLFFLLPYSFAMANEEAPYDVVHKTDIYEVRYYSDRLVAQVTNKGDNNSFRQLFNYISGQNKNSEKIAMTIPVTQTKKMEKCLCNFISHQNLTKKQLQFPSRPGLEGVSQTGPTLT